MRRTMVWIDPTRNFDGLFTALQSIENKLHHPPFYFIASKVRSVIATEMAERGLEIADRIVEYRTINSDYDATLYAKGMEFAIHTFEALQSAYRDGYGTPLWKLAPEMQEPFSIGMMDRLVSQMRPLLELRIAMGEVDATQLIYLIRPSPYGYAIYRSAFAMLEDIDVIANFQHNAERAAVHHMKASLDTVSAVPAKLHDLPIPRPDTPPKSGRVIISTNLMDHQYRMTSAPVIVALVDKADMIVADSRPTDTQAFVTQFSLESALASGRLNLCSKHPDPTRHKTLGPNREIIALVADSLEDHISSDDNPTYRAFAHVLSDYLRVYGLAFIRSIVHLEQAWSPHVAKAKRVVVTPGRTIESGVLTQLARRHNVPSVEIQSGTLSRNPRYIRPQADYVLSIESLSEGVYRDYLGFPGERIKTVGGPKLEYDIFPMRGVTRDEILVDHPRLSGLGDDRAVVMLASQPIGLDKAAAIFEMLAAGIAGARQPYTLLCKPHPNEVPAYRSRYRELAKAAGIDCIIDTELNALEAVSVSDIVTTYFSTVGLEAFALGKPVLVINPFGTRTPFDLNELGVAHETKTAEEVTEALHAFEQGQLEDLDSAPSLLCLRDGLTLERTTEFILSPDRVPTRPLPPRAWTEVAWSWANRLHYTTSRLVKHRLHHTKSRIVKYRRL